MEKSYHSSALTLKAHWVLRTFIMQSRPSYLEFEAWVAAQEGVDLSPENIRWYGLGSVLDKCPQGRL